MCVNCDYVSIYLSIPTCTLIYRHCCAQQNVSRNISNPIQINVVNHGLISSFAIVKASSYIVHKEAMCINPKFVWLNLLHENCNTPN